MIDYSDEVGFPAEPGRVVKTLADHPWSGRCGACQTLVYDDCERCPYCRHFPNSVATRALRKPVAA